MATLNYPIYGTYEKHVRAQKKDRIKHYPLGQVRTLWTDTKTWKVHARVWPSKMYVTPDCTTAEYVEAYCAANELVQQADAGLQQLARDTQSYCVGQSELNRLRRAA